ncbi:uncharacterized protein LOC128460698 isoform X3 [Pleuronectes platessa]|uniref:uncharacterized protein LOC128460698 isoform X3 n=1 Tax=Pleuronectes platessa TaxID=8262 RepID=UPI00232A0844|nr:uncharacterized protein LOC128460698 isoform X3 [Pleuronectes platessa]
MQRRRRINPMDDAKFFAHTGRDKLGLDINYINAFKGRGIFTSAPFEKGDFLCEYRAKEDGSLGRLVNDDHISPNAKMKYLNVQGKPHLCLFAIRDIVAGEEITYNYGDSDWPWRSKKSGGMSSDVKHGEAPCTAKLSTRTQKRSTHEAPKMMPTRTSAGRPECFNKGIDEDMPQGSPNTTNSQTLDEGHVQMTIERSQIEMTASNLNQTSPVLDPLTRTGQMMTERGQIEMSASNLNQTSPVLDPLTGIGQGINEDMPQGSPETTNSQTPDEGHVQMTTERGQIEMSASNLNQRSPVLDPLTRIGQMTTERGQIEMSASNLNQRSPVLDPLTRIAQMTTERGQIEMSASNLNQRSPVLDPLTGIAQMMTERGLIEMSASNLNQRSPVLDPLTRIAQCPKHHLVCATIGSLDKCVQCVGPVSSKWLGYQCKVCSGVWHKSCLRRINDNLQHHSKGQQFSECPEGELSSDQENMSDMEYVPDSESQEDEEDEDNEDSDARVPFMSNHSKREQIQVNPAMPDVRTSKVSDTSFPVVPSTSKSWQPLEDDMGANAAKMSNDKPEGEAEIHKPESTHLTLSKKNFCYVCGKPQSKISRHLKTHKTHAEIVHAFSLPEHSKERKKLIEKMRNKGNFRHNATVLQEGTGQLKVKKKTKAKVVAGNFIHCMYCQGMYIRKELWRHVRRCPCKPEDLDEEPGRTKVLGLAGAQQSMSCQQIPSGVWKLISVMRQDEVTSVVRNDFSIIQFAQSLYNRHGHDPTKYEYIRQKLREIGRLLLCLRTDFSVHNLEDAVKPANFKTVVQAVKKVSGFDDEKLSYRTPSLALKLGHALNKINDIIHCRALMAEDDELVKSTGFFKKLYTSKWAELVSHSALNTLSDAKYNKPSTLPFTEDVQMLHQFLQKSAESAFSKLKEEATAQNYGRLANATLSQIIVFNRRRAGEVSKMRLKSFEQRDCSKLHDDVAIGLSHVEQKLCNFFSRIEIMGKRGRKVAVLLTPSVLDALSLLISKRSECGICATNVFLFARPKSMSHYRGQDSLRVHASQCGAKHPEHLRSTQLRKHVATLSQVLNLKNNELDQVADFLGHDIRVHRDFYRLPVPTTQLAKISKLLLTMEKGHLSSLQGKSLDEIELEEELALTDTEAKDSEGESDESDTAVTASEGGNAEPVGAALASTLTEQVQETADLAGTVSSTVDETASPSEGKTHQEHHSRKVKKKIWSKAEEAAVMRHFKAYILKGRLATKHECSHCKMVEGSVLAQRTVQNIRDFVRNRGTTAKRKAEQQKL